METAVWVDAWQMECCGEPFEIGSRVSWTVGPPDREWLTAVLGAGTARAIRHAEERHGDLPKDTSALTGTVRGISAAYCRYAPRPDDDAPSTHYPVPGSGVTVELEKAERWTRRRPGLDFVGFVVRLDTEGA